LVTAIPLPSPTSVIGRAAAMANIFRVHVSCLADVALHLPDLLVEFRGLILVFFQCGFEYPAFSRGARLITGDAQPPTRKNSWRTTASGSNRH